MKIIRYGNRKYYTFGRYLNLGDIVSLVRNGQTFSVFDHKTNLDITNDTLHRVFAAELIHVDTETLIQLIRKV
jgi:polyhydroxyalkanoate synthesis regulator protein